MATTINDTTSSLAARRRRAAEWRSVLYFMLHGFGFVGTTLLLTWGRFVLFFLAIGGFSFDGMVHQLHNFTTRYLAADDARTGAFLNILAIAHMILSDGRAHLPPRPYPARAIPGRRALTWLTSPSSTFRPFPLPRLTLPIAKPRRGFGGFARSQILIGALLLAAAVWGMWVTRSLTAARQEHIVSARLSALVGDYVEAQRYSGSPPERVRAEMQAFMASLDKELQRRSATGQVVLVGEPSSPRMCPTSPTA